MKKKRWISLFLVVVTILTLAPTAFAADFEITNGILTKYTGTGGAVTIPNTVTTIGGSALANKAITGVTFATPVKVTTINQYAFRGNTFTSFTLPKTVKSIGVGVFMNCTKMTTFTFEGGTTKITEIPDSAFQTCGSLTAITIPEGVTSIGAAAFKGCGSLEKVDLPTTVTAVGNEAFGGCDKNKLEIHCYRGSAAEAYAQANGIKAVIKPAKISKLTLDKKIIALKVGGSATVTVTPTPLYAAEAVELIWGTDTSVASISNSGFTGTVDAVTKSSAASAISVSANNEGGEVVTATIPLLVLKPTGWITLGGATYYCDDDGVALGWKKINNRWYYFSINSAKMLTGWQTISGKKYYFRTVGDYKGAMLTGPQNIGGKNYYFNSDGVLSSGFKKINGRTYYYSVNNNQMLFGWQTIAGKKYYFRTSGDYKGAMLTGPQTIGGKKYYFDSNGALSSGFKKYNGNTYYYSVTTNEMLTGWQTIGGKKYYFRTVGDKVGAMLTGPQTIGGKKYYFDSNGAASSGFKKYNNNTYFYSASNYQMVTGWQTISGKKYYFRTVGDFTGAMLAGNKFNIGGKVFCFDSNGAMKTGWQTLGGKRYYFSIVDGHMITGTHLNIGGKYYDFASDGHLTKTY